MDAPYNGGMLELLINLTDDCWSKEKRDSKVLTNLFFCVQYIDVMLFVKFLITCITKFRDN